MDDTEAAETAVQDAISHNDDLAEQGPDWASLGMTERCEDVGCHLLTSDSHQLHAFPEDDQWVTWFIKLDGLVNEETLWDEADAWTYCAALILLAAGVLDGGEVERP